MTLWALEREHPDDYIAAPSYEAAAAVCGPTDHVRAWALGEAFHRTEVGNFLFNWEPAGVPT